MSTSKRGRKRNDNLPPNRARDVQRAFRARRAAHLQALEERVADLEEENNYLRQALSLPPSNRVALGKGPTGKDKGIGSSCSSDQRYPSSRASPVSLADSPRSHTSSESPGANVVPVSMSPSRPMTVLDHNEWSDSLISNDHHPTQPSEQSCLPDSGYLPSMGSSSMSMKPLVYNAYSSNGMPSTSKPALANSIYSNSQPFSHTSDRPMNANAYNGQAYTIRSDVRDPSSRSQYPFDSNYVPSYQSPDIMSSQSPSPANYSNSQPTPNHSIPSHQLSSHHDSARNVSLPYSNRRTVTDPRSFALSQTYPSQTADNVPIQTSRPEQFVSRQHGLAHPASTRMPYGPDGRLHQMT